jgi:hypothetical protein
MGTVQACARGVNGVVVSRIIAEKSQFLKQNLHSEDPRNAHLRSLWNSDEHPLQMSSNWTVLASNVLPMPQSHCVMWFLLWHSETQSVQLVLRESGSGETKTANDLLETLLAHTPEATRETTPQEHWVLRVGFADGGFRFSSVTVTEEWRRSCTIHGLLPSLGSVRWCLMMPQAPRVARNMPKSFTLLVYADHSRPVPAPPSSVHDVLGDILNHRPFISTCSANENLAHDVKAYVYQMCPCAWRAHLHPSPCSTSSTRSRTRTWMHVAKIVRWTRTAQCSCRSSTAARIQ